MRKMAPAAARQRGGGGAAILRQGFAKHLRERRRCHGREGDAKGSGVDALPPLHYI